MAKEKFLKLMAVLCEVYDKKISDALLDIYYATLSKVLGDDELQKAVELIIATRVYPSFPKPAEIIAQIKANADDKALLAWGSVLKAIEQHGSYKTVEFEDKIIHQVLELLGGWEKTGSWLVKEVPFIEKEFLRLYALYEKHPRKNCPKILVGYHDRVNSIKNYDAQDVKFIPSKLATQKKLELNKKIGG